MMCGQLTSKQAAIWAEPEQGKVLARGGKQNSIICGMACARKAADEGYDVDHTAGFHRCPTCVEEGFPTGYALVSTPALKYGASCCRCRGCRLTGAHFRTQPWPLP